MAKINKNPLKNKRCKVDIVKVKFNYFPSVDTNQKECKSFKDILEELNGKQYPIIGIENTEAEKDLEEKIFTLEILKTDIPNCVLGIITTAQIKNLPPIPIIDRETNETKQLDINPDKESLAFANIFLLDTNKQILLYEVNKNGCYLNKFKDFIYNTYNNIENNTNSSKIDIDFFAIFKSNEYQRILGLQYFNDIEIKIHKPSDLIRSINENDSIYNYFEKTVIEADKINSETVTIRQSIRKSKRNVNGLQNILNIVNQIRSLISKGHKNNIRKVIVKGYTEDPESSINSINLLGDTFNEYFEIKTEVLQSDLQKNERKIGIEALYKKLLSEFNKI